MRISARIEIIVIIVLTFALLASAHLYVMLYSSASTDGTTLTVVVPKGASFKAVATSLEKAGVIRDAKALSFAARITGAYRKVRAGEYEFRASMPPMEILDALVEGRVKKYQVTIPEGYNVYEVALALAHAGLADEADFLARARDPRFVASLGLEGQSAEGYLFPDTYRFEKGMSADEMIRKMTDRFKSMYYPELDAAGKAQGMTLGKAVTLASIIEKETGDGSERPLISAVFHNRLRKRIKLQSDPTVIYGVIGRGFDGNLTKRHLLEKTPYNTYVNYGLPPGPIANPGRAALKAAVSPASADYLYFVSMNNGSHHFSTTLKEHNNAVNLYQRRRGR
ncbi:MAG: endolytic transglycosylase MltG [Deltaproteobacteria bacterium]|nr:endolytic transglycosylase MltG [Deltaproteobacteria bacterium]